jgi:hypothetical protein
MSFEKITPITFVYKDQNVGWTIQRLDKPWSTQKNLNWQICCQHQVFTDIFNSPSMLSSSLKTLLEEGRKENEGFFDTMEDSFMSYHS